MTDDDAIHDASPWSPQLEPEWPEFDADAGLGDLYARARLQGITLNGESAMDDRHEDVGRETVHEAARRLLDSIFPPHTRQPEVSRTRELIGAVASRENNETEAGFAIETLVSSHVQDRGRVAAEIADHRSILDLCQETHSVAEIAAHLKQPLGTVRDLVDDLAGKGMVTVHPPSGLVGGQPSPQFVESVFSGLSGLNPSNPPSGRSATRATKIVVTGGSHAVRSTFVDAVSGAPPMAAHAYAATDGENQHAVLNFGRISLCADVILYLVDVPGQRRYSAMWHELMAGAIGAIVLVDPNRILHAVDSINYFEVAQIPYVTALHRFDDHPGPSTDEVRKALAISKNVPVVEYDSRSGASGTRAMISLVDRAIKTRQGYQ